jgi:epoxide hydrolase-like predicted phosphatase
MNIQAIIFDIGGVLIRTPDRSSRQRWEDRLGLAEWESETVVFSGEMGTKAQAGTITTEELWQWVAGHLAFSAEELAQFRQDFWAGDVLDQELVALIRRLKGPYQTAIISNATDSLRQALQEVYPIADAFDLIVVSAEEKVMKPEPEIYQRTLERLGCEPAEAVFVDDNLDNIEAARSLGLHTIHFNPQVNVAAELKRLGVKV